MLLQEFKIKYAIHLVRQKDRTFSLKKKKKRDRVHRRGASWKPSSNGPPSSWILTEKISRCPDCLIDIDKSIKDMKINALVLVQMLTWDIKAINST